MFQLGIKCLSQVSKVFFFGGGWWWYLHVVMMSFQLWVVSRVKGVFLYKILVPKPEGKVPPLRLRHNWKDNITMYCREIMFRAVHVVLNLDLCYSGYRPVAGCCEQCNEFSGPTKKKKWGIYWLAKQLLSSQKYLSSTELFKSEEF